MILRIDHEALYLADFAVDGVDMVAVAHLSLPHGHDIVDGGGYAVSEQLTLVPIVNSVGIAAFPSGRLATTSERSPAGSGSCSPGMGHSELTVNMRIPKITG